MPRFPSSATAAEIEHLHGDQRFSLQNGVFSMMVTSGLSFSSAFLPLRNTPVEVCTQILQLLLTQLEIAFLGAPGPLFRSGNALPSSPVYLILLQLEALGDSWLLSGRNLVLTLNRNATAAVTQSDQLPYPQQWMSKLAAVNLHPPTPPTRSGLLPVDRYPGPLKPRQILVFADCTTLFEDLMNPLPELLRIFTFEIRVLVVNLIERTPSSGGLQINGLHIHAAICQLDKLFRLIRIKEWNPDLTIVLRFNMYCIINSWTWDTPGALALSRLYGVARVIVDAPQTILEHSFREFLVSKVKRNPLALEWRPPRGVLAKCGYMPPGPLTPKVKNDLFARLTAKDDRLSRRLGLRRTYYGRRAKDATCLHRACKKVHSRARSV